VSASIWRYFNSSSFPSTKWFSDELKKIVKGNIDFCEVGWGSGIISCLVALNDKDAKGYINRSNIPIASE